MLQRITVKDYDSKVFFVSRPDKADRSVNHPPVHEKMRGQRDRYDRRSHDDIWPQRRMEVLTQWAHSVLKWLEPIGYVSPTNERADLKEIEATQCIVHPYEHRMGRDCATADIAPEWLRLQTNNVDCVSMYAEYTDENGDTHEVGENAEEQVLMAERMCAEAIAATLDANVEAFVREHDRKLWYSSRPKAAIEVVTDDGRRGLVPKVNHPWTREELLASMKHLGTAWEIRQAAQRRANTAWKKQRAMKGVTALLTDSELAMVKADERLQHILDTLVPQDDAEQGEAEAKPYINSEACPNCIDGMVADEYGDPEDCPVCGGTAKVLACIGFDGLPVADALETETPSEHEPASDWFIQRLYSHVAW